MNSFSEPFILKDKSRLPEIYKLRFRAYKTHQLAKEFDPELFQSVESCSDILDDKGLHFLIINNETNEIAATYRLKIVESIDQLPYHNIFKPFALPHEKPFLFYSRLVVDEKYRNNDLANNLQIALLKFHIESKILFGIGTAYYLVSWLQKYGFELLGEIDLSLDGNYHYGKSFALIIHRENIKLLNKTK